jgi:hypothetical protein
MHLPLGYKNDFKNDDEITYMNYISSILCVLSSNSINLWTCGSVKKLFFSSFKQGLKLVLKEPQENLGKNFIWKLNDLYVLIEGKDNQSLFFFKIVIEKFHQFSLKQLNFTKIQDFGLFTCFTSIDKETILIGTSMKNKRFNN